MCPFTTVNVPRCNDGVRLVVLDNADLGGAQCAAVELEALLLDEEDGVLLLVGLGGHKGGLVLVGVELFAVGVQSLEAVLLEGGHEDVLGHLETLVEIEEVLEVLGAVLGLELLGGDHAHGTVEVVHAVDEVLGELLDGKVAGLLDFALSAVLEVAEVGDGTQALVLKSRVSMGSIEVGRTSQLRTFHSRASASLASRLFLSSARASVSPFLSLPSTVGSSAALAESDSFASLYHLETAGWVARNVKAGAMNCD